MEAEMPGPSSSSYFQENPEIGADEEYEEEIMVMTLEGVLDTDPVYKAVRSGDVKFREVDCEEPVVQIGSSIFTGKWTQTLGTDLIFCTKREGADELSAADEHTLDLIAVSDTRLAAEKAMLISTETAANNDGTTNQEDIDAAPSVLAATAASVVAATDENPFEGEEELDVSREANSADEMDQFQGCSQE